MWDEFTYPFSKAAAVEVWEWISNFIPHFIMNDYNYLSVLGVKLKYVDKWGSSSFQIDIDFFYTLRTTKLLGVYWFHSVRPSVRPSVHSTVLPLVLGVAPRQKPQINGSMVLGADESPWPCGTPSWYTPLSWMILSKQKNLHLFLSQYNCVFL